MRNIECNLVTTAVSSLFQDACINLPYDVTLAIKRALNQEESALGREALDTIVRNIQAASNERIPICQDTGTAVVFLEIGQDVHITGGNLYKAVNKGVHEGYTKGFLRKSMVLHPFSARQNSGNNTPAVIHTEIVSGSSLKIIALPKGGGAENCSRLTVLAPAKGRQGIIEFCVKLVSEYGCNACPPLIVGIGIGGTTDKTMLLAKRAIIRKVGKPNHDSEIADLENTILTQINKLGIGPMGYGGRITALAVHIEAFPAHIASLPVAVNLQCWCSRHKEIIL